MVIKCSRGTDGNYYFYDTRKKQRVSEPKNFTNYSSCKDSKARLASRYIKERDLELLNAKDTLLLLDGLVHPNLKLYQLEAKLKAKEDALDALTTLVDKCNPDERKQYDELQKEVNEMKKEKEELNKKIKTKNSTRQDVLNLAAALRDIKTKYDKTIKNTPSLATVDDHSKLRKQIVDVITKYNYLLSFKELEMLEKIFVTDEEYGPSLVTGTELVSRFTDKETMKKFPNTDPASRVFIHTAAALAAYLEENPVKK